MLYSHQIIRAAGGSRPAQNLKSILRRMRVMSIHRWVPCREAVALQNRVNSLFHDSNEGESAAAIARFTPAVDIYEDAQKVVLKLEGPGIEGKDRDIAGNNGRSTSTGR